MLYDEFIKGTGCKENDHNYKVYKDLEVMYMNSNLTKEQIYEYGKKLVDNSKSQEEIEFESNIREEIKMYQEAHKNYLKDAKVYLSYYREDKTDKWAKDKADWNKYCAGQAWRKIQELKWVLQS